MTGNNRYLSILTLNVNGLNAPIKRHRIANWIKKQDSTVCCLQETHLNEKNKQCLRVKGWKKVFQANGPYKQAGVSILISDKVDFRLNSIRRDDEGHFILMKGTIHQEEISILNIFAPNTKKKPLMALRAQIDANTVIVGDLNTTLSPINRSSRQKLSKETSELFHTLDQIYMVNIYRVFHPTNNQ
jgi:exonuclease III